MTTKLSNIVNLTNFIKLIKKNQLYVNILFISALLIPYSLAAGPAIVEIVIFLIVFSYIFHTLAKIKKISFNKFDLLIAAFFFITIISSLVSNYALISLKSSFFSIRFIILIYAIVFLLKKLDYSFKYFAILFFACFAFIVFDGYVQFIFGKDLLLISQESKTVISGVFGNEKKLGSFLARTFPLIIGFYLLISKKKINEKINNFIIISIIVFPLIYFTSERLAMLYFFITLLFFVVWASKINKDVIVIVSLVTFIIPFILLAFDINEFNNKIKDSYNQLFPKNKIVYYSEQHSAFAFTSIELFKKKPILGIGPNNYRRECGKIKTTNNVSNCSTHPHNIFFQLISEIGLIGILPYIIFNVLIFYEVFKFLFRNNYKRVSFFFLLPVIYYLNPFVPSGNFFNNWYMCIGIFSLPFYLHLIKTKKSV